MSHILRTSLSILLTCGALSATAAAPALDPTCGEGAPKSKAFLKTVAIWNTGVARWNENGVSAGAVNKLRSMTGLPLRLWVSDKAPTKVLSNGLLLEGPGGNSLVSFQKVLPPVESEGALHPDRVIEFNEVGKILRQWPVEADRPPKGVRGTELVIERQLSSLCLKNESDKTEATVLIGIKPDGSLRALPSDTGGSFEDMPACPEKAKAQSGSAYLRCRRFKDANGKSHILGFETPMT